MPALKSWDMANRSHRATLTRLLASSGVDLDQLVHRHRADGESWRTIAGTVTDTYGITVSRYQLSRWYAPADPARGREAS